MVGYLSYEYSEILNCKYFEHFWSEQRCRKKGTYEEKGSAEANRNWEAKRPAKVQLSQL
jgi:hypothetical protein